MCTVGYLHNIVKFLNNNFLKLLVNLLVECESTINSRVQESENTESVKPQSSSVPLSARVTASTGNDKSGASISKQTSQPSFSEPHRVVPVPKNEARKSIPEDLNKQSHKLSSVNQGTCTSKSGEGLNLISTFVKAEPGKQIVDQKQAGNASMPGTTSKDSKRRGSNSSSVSALSDIIQDIRISPREAKVAAENIPTKGT